MMTNDILRFLAIGVLVLLAGCELETVDSDNGNDNNSTFDEERVAIEVLLIDGYYYPASRFICAEREEPAEPSESCPSGSGCDERHWHGSGIAAIAVDAPASLEEAIQQTIDDPDNCRCGHAKVCDLEIQQIELDLSDVLTYEEQFERLEPSDCGC